MPRVDWTTQEIRPLLRAYFEMLAKERAGVPYRKADYLREVSAEIQGRRTKGAIEFKMENVSAVLARSGADWITGYKPAKHLQEHLLPQEIATFLESQPPLQLPTPTATESPNVSYLMPSSLPEAVFEPAPPIPPSTQRTRRPPPLNPRQVARIDYITAAGRAQTIGRMGELVTLAAEKHRLQQAGRPDLATRVEHVSVTRGDGLGYDIQSFSPSGDERFIEVKTTPFEPTRPFFLSPKELEFAQETGLSYRLARVHHLWHHPAIFELDTDTLLHLNREPNEYVVSWRTQT